MRASGRYFKARKPGAGSSKFELSNPSASRRQLKHGTAFDAFGEGLHTLP